MEDCLYNIVHAMHDFLKKRLIKKVGPTKSITKKDEVQVEKSKVRTAQFYLFFLPQLLHAVYTYKLLIRI